MAQDIAVAVVDADTPGNVGTVARAMKNFGFSDLLLVSPPSLEPDGEAYGFAGKAREDVLPNAREITFDELVASYHTVGFTAITNEDGSKHVRYPFSTPVELSERLQAVDAPTALVFGRERVGLTNEELARLDEVCSIPASPDYPTLNLGQAATVALYELRDLTLAENQLPDPAVDRAAEGQIEAFYDQIEDFLAGLHYPAEKRPKTMRLVRRLIGRAHPTERELTTLRGLFRRARQQSEHGRSTGTDGDE